MVRRRGASTLGCLVLLLVGVAIAYFGFNAAEVYVRYYRFQDAMKQQARFAGRNADHVIQRKLAAVADSLGLPEDAHKVRIFRRATRVQIIGDYTETIELPLTIRTVRLRPRAEAPL